MKYYVHVEERSKHVLVIEQVIGDVYYNKCETKNKYKSWRWEFVQVLYMGRFLIFNIYIYNIYTNRLFIVCALLYASGLYMYRQRSQKANF